MPSRLLPLQHPVILGPRQLVDGGLDEQRSHHRHLRRRLGRRGEFKILGVPFHERGRMAR